MAIAQKDPRQGHPQRKNGIWLLVAGMAAGWLMGLSTTPVVSGVVTALIALLVSAAGVAAGISIRASKPAQQTEQEPETSKTGPTTVQAAAVAALAFGLMIGASVGVFARTNHFLGRSPKQTVDDWVAAGVPRKEVAMMLFKSTYASGDETKGGGRYVDVPALFATVSAAEYDQFQSLKDDPKGLRQAMLQSNSKAVQEFAKQCTDHPDECLKAAVEHLLQKAGH